MRSSAALLAVGLALAPAGGASAAPYSAGSPSVRTDRVIYLDEESSNLKDAVLDPASTPEGLRAQWNQMMDGIPRVDTVNIQPYQARGWEQPDFRKNPDLDRRLGTMDSLMDAFRKTLLYKDIPSPVRTDLIDDYKAVRDFKKDGKVRFDDGKVLSEGMLGAYRYRTGAGCDPERDGEGIYLHEQLKVVARHLGDMFAALVLDHEGNHRRRHMECKLSPEDAIAGEIAAFDNQGKVLEAVDPKGEIISRFWYCYVQGHKCYENGQPLMAPRIVKEVLRHFWELQVSRRNGTLKEFVQNLGYRNHEHAAESGDNDHQPKG